MKRITRKRKTQAVVEYFLAFALIIILTVLGFHGAIKTVKDKSKDFFVRKVNDMGIDGSPGSDDEEPISGGPGSDFSIEGPIQPIEESTPTQVYAMLPQGRGRTYISYNYSDIDTDGDNIYMAVFTRRTEAIGNPNEGNHRSINELSLYRSDDQGQTWEDMGIITSEPGYYDWVDIRTAGNHLYIVTSTKVFLSNDEGNSWAEISLPNEITGGFGTDKVDFYPLTNNNFVIAYVSKGGITTAITNDGGVTWNKHVVFRGNLHNNSNLISGSYPKICVEANGNLVVAYQKKEMFWYHWRSLGLETIESTDGGQTWSKPHTAVSSYRGRVITTGPDVMVFQPFNYHLYGSGSEALVGYEINEASYEISPKTIGFAKGDPAKRRWESQVVKPDGKLVRLADAGSSNFTASGNGRYLVFNVSGAIGDETGTFLVYSNNGGDAWHYKKIPEEEWFGMKTFFGKNRRMPQMYVNNDGVVLFNYPVVICHRGEGCGYEMDIAMGTL